MSEDEREYSEDDRYQKKRTKNNSDDLLTRPAQSKGPISLAPASGTGASRAASTSRVNCAVISVERLGEVISVTKPPERGFVSP